MKAKCIIRKVIFKENYQDKRQLQKPEIQKTTSLLSDKDFFMAVAIFKVFIA